MADPAFYSPPPASVERRETHSSIVFLAGDRAYKIKKPVRFDFLDYSSLPVRRRMCEQEVALNRRLAPRTYLGVRSIVASGSGFSLAGPDSRGALEYAVEMRRFADAQTLASALSHHGVEGDRLREVGARIAAFHAGARVASTSDPRPAIRRIAGDTFTNLLELVEPAREADVAAAQCFTDAYLVRRRAVFVERAAAGLVRDGHGDLRAEHVLLQDPIEIVDCLEFDPGLRETDVAADLAFLVMDLERLGARALTPELLRGYRAAGGDPGDDGLLAFYAAQRAWVRAKVDLLRAAQENSGHERAQALFDLARRFTWQARQPLLLVVCGLSGSGKSHLAAALSAASGLDVVGSDVVRKQLVRAQPEGATEGVYTRTFNARTYAELGRRAALELNRSGGVIVDATFRRADDRRAFTDAAGDAFSAARFVECLAPRELRLLRVERRERGPSVSDATIAIAGDQVFEDLAETSASLHLPLRTDRPAPLAVADIEHWLDSPSV